MPLAWRRCVTSAGPSTACLRPTAVCARPSPARNKLCPLALNSPPGCVLAPLCGSLLGSAPGQCAAPFRVCGAPQQSAVPLGGMQWPTWPVMTALASTGPLVRSCLAFSGLQMSDGQDLTIRPRQVTSLALNCKQGTRDRAATKLFNCADFMQNVIDLPVCGYWPNNHM